MNEQQKTDQFRETVGCVLTAVFVLLLGILGGVWALYYEVVHVNANLKALPAPAENRK